jgi:hypothetical protein
VLQLWVKPALPIRHTIGTVPRAYEGMEEETIKIKKLKIGKCNTNSN